MTESKIINWTNADDGMVEQAIRRGASRRDLLKMLMAGGVAASVGGTIIGRSMSAVAATPVSGGHLKAVAYSSSNADTLDPAKASLSTDYVRCCSLYNRLTFLDRTGFPQNELAEAVETKDALSWTITLRKGVQFHDGKLLTADDVVYSLKRHLDPAVGSKVAKIAAQMTDIKATAPLTVQITLASANADLPTILAMHHFMIVQDGTTDFSKGIGTGAFKLEVFEPGVRSLMKRNTNYFKGKGANVETFEFFAIADENARVNALLSGDVHLITINPRSIRLVESRQDVVVKKTMSGAYTNLNVRLDMAPGDKKDFVDGLKHLINREQILKAALRGVGSIANDQPVSPVNIFCNKDLQPKAFDPEKAKFLFQKAGMLGQTLPIVASEAADASIDMAMILQQTASEIGMKFDVQRVPSDGYWSNYWLKAPMHFGNINPRPTADLLFSLFYASEAAWNESRFKSERFDKLLVEARAELDTIRRKEMYGEMQTMVAENAGTIIPAYMANVAAHSKKLQGLEPNPLGGLMGYAFAEYVWLDA